MVCMARICLWIEQWDAHIIMYLWIASILVRKSDPPVDCRLLSPVVLNSCCCLMPNSWRIKIDYTHSADVVKEHVSIVNLNTMKFGVVLLKWCLIRVCNSGRQIFVLSCSDPAWEGSMITLVPSKRCSAVVVWSVWIIRDLSRMNSIVISCIYRMTPASWTIYQSMDWRVAWQ